MVLEYVEGGELFDRIALKGKYGEAKGRKIFQQLIDGVSYCHNKGVFHRDIKLQNILLDAKGNIKIADFGLCALASQFRGDKLLHTACGTPNYVAPEVLSMRGYKGAASDVWSCGVILYAILTGCLPFDDRNIAVMYYMIKEGNFKIPNKLSPGAQNIIRRILDPDPVKRITMEGIKADKWFKQDYCPAIFKYEDTDGSICDEAFTMNDKAYDQGKSPKCPRTFNAFDLIGMSPCLDLSGFFENEDVSNSKIRFTSNYSAKDLLQRIDDTAVEMGFQVQQKMGRLIVIDHHIGQGSVGRLSILAELFEISPTLYIVELQRTCGDYSVYLQVCQRLTNDLGVLPSLSEGLLT